MNENKTAETGDSTPEAIENDRLLSQLVQDTTRERVRLARLSQRVTGMAIRSSVRKRSLLDEFDSLISLGDISLGRLGRVVLLFQEEGERAKAEAERIFDIRSGKRIKPDVNEVHRRVLRRLEEGDVIPGILFRERPHLAHLAPLVETVVQEQRQLREFNRRRRGRRYH